jgi:hypothetical protein
MYLCWPDAFGTGLALLSASLAMMLFAEVGVKPHKGATVMNTLLKENLDVWEMGARLLLGVLVLSVIMFSSIVPVWVSLIAVYPVITAIMAWDPVYALIHASRRTPSINHHKPGALAVG